MLICSRCGAEGPVDGLDPDIHPFERWKKDLAIFGDLDNRMGGVPTKRDNEVTLYGLACGRCVWGQLSAIRQFHIDRGNWIIPNPGESYRDAELRQEGP